MRSATQQLMPPFFTVRQVADTLGISEKTVHRMTQRGELKRHKVGHQVRISECDLKAYIALSRGL